jgi:hypothetical protein
MVAESDGGCLTHHVLSHHESFVDLVRVQGCSFALQRCL